MPVTNKNKNLDEIINDPALDEPVNPVQEEEPIPNQTETPSEVNEATPETNDNNAEEVTDPEEVTTATQDYKKKFANSTREANALFFQNQKYKETIESAANVPEPTEEEVRDYARLRGADFDDLDELTKGILKDTLVGIKTMTKIREAASETQKVNEWADKVDAFVTNPDAVNKYPSLLDYEDEFKKFCSRPSRVGQDFDDLVGAFMYKLDLVEPVKKKGSMLLSGGNGRAVPPAPEGTSADEAASLRVRDPKEYRRLIKAGKIQIDIP